MQSDLDVANLAGAAYRAAVNAALQSLGTLSSGTSAPSTTYARMLWADTTTNLLKRRNAANSGWIVLWSLDESFTLSRSSNTILGITDREKLLVATAGFTQTLTAAATLGDGWFVDVVVNSGATLIVDPNSSETIDGATTKSIVGPSSGRIVCDGTLFRTIGFSPITTRGDLIRGGSGGAAERVALGAAGMVLRSDGTDAAWGAAINLGTVKNTTSGTSIDYTGIPAWARRIHISLVGFSTNGTSPPILQLGDSGGLENSGYSGAFIVSNGASGGSAGQNSSGFRLTGTHAASNIIESSITLRLVDPSTNTWNCENSLGLSDAAFAGTGGGNKSLSAPLDRIRLTTVGGLDVCDLGKINISHE